MGWLDGKQIVDALYGNSYDPLIQKIYRGDELIFERNSWDYHIENWVFDGTDECVVNTGITPFSSDNINKGWKMEFSLTLDSTSSGAVTQKMYIVCNTSATANSGGLYWSGRARDEVSHNQQRINDPGFALGGNSTGTGRCEFRMRGTEHMSDRTPTIGNILGISDGTYETVFNIEYDKSSHSITVTTYNLDQYGEHISGLDDTSMINELYGVPGGVNTFSVSNTPIILGGCYNNSYTHDENNPYWRVVGNGTDPVTLNYFRFKYL